MSSANVPMRPCRVTRNLVAHREVPHIGSYACDDAGDVVPEPELAVPDLGVQRVDVGGADPDQDVAVSQLGF